jgi:hypothetical protein
VAPALPRAEVAVQLRAVAEALHAEAVVKALLRHALAAEVESQRRAVVKLPLRAEAAMVELPLHAEPAEMESQRRAVVELRLRAEEAL